MNQVVRFGTLAGLLLSLSLLTAPPAIAHAEMVSAEPAADSSASMPLEVTINFSEPVELAFSTVTVKREDGTAVEMGPPNVEPSDAKVLHVPFAAPPPAPGTLTVEWTVVSTDGHKSSGSYSFTVVP